ncbi:hypothetical protein ROLI_021450 [Roseobacter fucihabitans]|uniref:DUF4198 domain-containing protein n=1 Tax=Roseobacter fucihabitans TaxID=1537242 RepID=A0ABZ2BW91_9RHOB|nr:DUF4198 domain-containing protein [Roseobacter litoralis]MBC6966400.1 Nickel uptake substrate-specific transmembrane region [Roseobacter litoralis]
MIFSRLLLGCAMLAASPVLGHEFWIDPQKYQVETGAPLVADLRNGQNFEGITLAWFDNRFTRFDMAQGDAVQPVEGRIGDTPALNTLAPGDGLLVILHETTPSSLTYKVWDKFLAFAKHKDFTKAAADHAAAGWPQEGFQESYTRHAKSLIAVGTGSGADRAYGMATEFVALTNPYEPGFDNQMRVRVQYNNAPRTDAQIEVFERAPDGTVNITLTRTDLAGEASIPVLPGHHYLFDAVVLRASPQAGTSEQAPVWETLWAALTFAVPGG